MGFRNVLFAPGQGVIHRLIHVFRSFPVHKSVLFRLKDNSKEEVIWHRQKALLKAAALDILAFP